MYPNTCFAGEKAEVRKPGSWLPRASPGRGKCPASVGLKRFPCQRGAVTALSRVSMGCHCAVTGAAAGPRLQHLQHVLSRLPRPHCAGLQPGKDVLGGGLHLSGPVRTQQNPAWPGGGGWGRLWWSLSDLFSHEEQLWPRPQKLKLIV